MGSPSRIVSLEPSVTATLVSLGLRDKLIAVTKYCKRLAEVENLPQVEITWSVDAEQVAALQPDLVIAGTPYRAGKVDELLQRKVPVLCLYPQSLADVQHSIEWLACLCRVPERGDALVEEMQATLRRLADAASGQPCQRIYIETWMNPLFSAEPWVSEIVAAFGGEFVPQPPGRQVTEAEIIIADPEVIVLNWAGVEKINPEMVYRREGWEAVSAVQHQRVRVVDEITLNAPGPNLIAGMQELFQAMYPDLK